jgi:SanA protein
MRWIKWFLTVLLLALSVLLALDIYISYQAQPYIYTDMKNVPPKKAAQLLGTNKYIAKGKKNYYYLYRIQAAVALWKAGKIKAIVVSGTNDSQYYNETRSMYKDLIKAGIPKRYISQDFAGFRTLDSIVRAEAIFDLKEYIIISQKFHLERAIFIARAKGQDVIGFEARSKKGTKAAYKMKLREYMARAKAFLDVYILKTEPKFYGKKEKVHYKR